jgi:hypothetical protein
MKNRFATHVQFSPILTFVHNSQSKIDTTVTKDVLLGDAY